MKGIRGRTVALITILLIIYSISFVQHPFSSLTSDAKHRVNSNHVNINTIGATTSRTGTGTSTDTQGAGDLKEISLNHSADAEKPSVNRKAESKATRGGGHDPYLNRWQRRFASSKARNKTGGYLFFKHIRKAGGTSLRTYFRDVLAYHNISRHVNEFRAAKSGRQSDEYQIHYIEHEFQTIDWQCPSVDPRWRESLRVIVLRHPIERHLSEFFFSGNGKKFFPIDKEQLSSNQTYTEELASFLSVQVPNWMKGIGMRRKKTKNKGKFNMYFGGFYTDNFQLRALSGCSSGDCLEGKEITDAEMEKIREFHPSFHLYSEPVPRCTNYFRQENTTGLFDTCARPGNIKESCSIGCDGPCFYPSVAWGELGSNDVQRAIETLKMFDAVLLMEELDDQDQSDFLSDVLGVPRGAEFSLTKRSSASNTGVVKKGKKEKSRFYQDLLLKLGLKHIESLLLRENKLEIDFFNQAMKLNAMMIDQWKRENDAK